VTATLGQQELIDAISGVLEADERIGAAWLAGSLGKGGGDEWSDVDVLALATGAPVPEVSADFARNIDRIAEPVLVNPLYGGAVLNVVTADWRRFDISFAAPEFLGRYHADDLKALFNRSGHEPPSPPRPAYRPSPERVLQLVSEFIRVLGLSGVVLGRQEYVMGLSGVDILRRTTIDLMIEQNGIGPAERGGMLHTSRLLTPDQMAELEALGPVAPTSDGVLAASLDLARIFLPRAKALASEVGAEWPQAFEDATRRHLLKTFGEEP
jgi:predicted nucleotidyltransferase